MQNKTLIGLVSGIKKALFWLEFLKTLREEGLVKPYIQTILDGMSKGLKEISSNISLNNVPVLNLYSKLGFSYREPKYILHYWS